VRASATEEARLQNGDQGWGRGLFQAGLQPLELDDGIGLAAGDAAAQLGVPQTMGCLPMTVQVMSHWQAVTYRS
jgi:hypothetical protein